jgi:hypothetical protein
MEAAMFKVVRLETLNLLFKDHEVGEKLKFRETPCFKCGRPVSIEVQKTSAGYGLLEGILYEPEGIRLVAQCSACSAHK